MIDAVVEVINGTSGGITRLAIRYCANARASRLPSVDGQTR